MTTKEFIRYVKQYGYTAFIDNGYIKVYNPLWFHILSVSVNEINKLECVDTVGGDGCIAMGILKGAIEYANTPIKERDEEHLKSERFYIRTNTNVGYLNKSENGYSISDSPLKSFGKEELSKLDKDPYINLAKYSYVLEKVK